MLADSAARLLVQKVTFFQNGLSDMHETLFLNLCADVPEFVSSPKLLEINLYVQLFVCIDLCYIFYSCLA